MQFFCTAIIKTVMVYSNRCGLHEGNLKLVKFSMCRKRKVCLEVLSADCLNTQTVF